MRHIPCMFFLILLLMIASSCRQDNINPSNSDWLIPAAEVRDGGPGKDGIPSIDDPVFTSIESAEDFLSEEDLVVGFMYGNLIRAYPHIILDWHEIVNDEIDNLQFSVIYCPLTGSATVWNREFNGKTSSYGVSGLLFNTNIIPYDRETDSNWSQMRLECVNGERSGESPETFHVVETSWKNWKSMYPNSQVLSTNTGFNRDYGTYPYGGYRTNEQLIFPVEVLDDRLPAKERALAVIVNGEAKGYPISELGTSNAPIEVVQENFQGVDLVIVGSNERNMSAAFNRRLPDGTILNFTAIQGSLPAIMKDQEGNEWDIFGSAINGTRQGQRLEAVESFVAYWFAWGTFYPDLDLFKK